MDPPKGALKAATNGRVSFCGAMSLPCRRVPDGHTQLAAVQKLWFWKWRALWPLSSWTLARPSVDTVTTSPVLEVTLKTVFDLPSSEPVQPGAAWAWAGCRETWASAGSPKP